MRRITENPERGLACASVGSTAALRGGRCAGCSAGYRRRNSSIVFAKQNMPASKRTTSRVSSTPFRNGVGRTQSADSFVRMRARSTGLTIAEKVVRNTPCSAASSSQVFMRDTDANQKRRSAQKILRAQRILRAPFHQAPEARKKFFVLLFIKRPRQTAGKPQR